MTQPHVLQRLHERYPGSPWCFEDLQQIEQTIRNYQIVFSADADPGHRVVCVRYGYPEPLLFVVENEQGRVITALPTEARPRWAGRAFIQATSTKSTQALPAQKGNTYAS